MMRCGGNGAVGRVLPGGCGFSCGGRPGCDRIVCVQGEDDLGEELGGFLLTDGQRSGNEYGGIVRQV